MKHLKQRTRRKNQAIITWAQKSFRRTYRDTPASELSNNSLADTVNMLPFDTRARVRHGTRTISSGAAIPFVVGRQDYEATKTGSVITKTVGTDFSATDIGYYFVWANNTADLIIGFTDTDNVTVEDSVAQGPATGGGPGKIRARINGDFFHKEAKRSYLQIGTQVFFTDELFFTYTEVFQNSGTALTNTKSTFREYRGKVYMATEVGHFVIDTNQTEFYLLKINTDNKINELHNQPNGTKDISDHFGRRYVYTFARLAGSYFDDRYTNKIIKETAPNLRNPIDNTDFKPQFYKNIIRVDPNDTSNLLTYNNGGTYTTVLGAALDKSLSFFQSIISAGITARFQVAQVLVVREVRFNPSLAGTFEALADILQEAIRATYPDADGLAEVVVNAGTTGVSFEFNGGSFDGSHTEPFLFPKFNGTNDSVLAFKLIDSSATFETTGVNVGDAVDNNTDGTSTTVSSVDSETQLSLTADIFLGTGKLYLIDIPGQIANELQLTSGQVSPTLQGAQAQHIGYNNDIVPASGDVAGALVPDNNKESQWTHVSIYGTVNILEPTNNLAQYAWLADRPLMKAFKASVTTDGLVTLQEGSFVLDDLGQNIVFGAASGISEKIIKFISSTQVRILSPVFGITSAVASLKLIDATGLNFLAGDVGKTVVNPVDETSALITNFVSIGEVDIDTNIFLNVGNRYELYQDVSLPVQSSGTPAAMGTLSVYQMSQTGTTVTVELGETPFVLANDGRELFWSDGKTSLITAFISSSSVSVADSTTRASLAAGFEFTGFGIGFNDVVTDDILIDRISDFPLRTRLWTALPNGRFGAFAPGFYFVANKGDSDFFYSQFSQDFEYLGGHHYLPFQQHPIQDRILGLEEFPEQTIIYGSRTTWRVNTNTVNILRIPEVGDVVAVTSGVSLVDGKIGVIHDGGIQTVELGEQIIITSEPGVRVFDGFKYSDNLAIDGNGRQMFLKDLESLHKIYATAYDKVMGFIFWGADTNSNITNFFTEENVPLTKCFRVGIRQEQARGWGELNGTDWIFSNMRVGGHTIFTNTEEEVLVLFDESGDGRPYALDKDVFTDKRPSEIEGTEITWSIKFKEHKAKKESWRIQHLLSHFYVRPQEERDQTAAPVFAHDAVGFRTAQILTVKIFEDGSTAKFSEIEDVDFQDEIAFDLKVKANRIQLELSGTASELQLVEHDTDYVEADTRALPQRRTMSWHDFQSNLSSVQFWVSRGDDITLDRATGNKPNDIPNITQVTGPDTRTNSAIQMAVDADIVYATSPSLGTGNFSFLVWAKDIDFIIGSPKKLIEVGSSYIAVTRTSGPTVDNLNFFDGVNTYSGLIDVLNAGQWNAFRVSRISGDYKFQLDNNAEVSVTPSTVESISGVVRLDASSVTGSEAIFDPRVVNKAVTKANFDYYYNDVLDLTNSNGFGGQKTLPQI